MTGTRPEDAGVSTGPSLGKARIMRSALLLFARNGYAGTSLKTIADDVGVSTAALYWHFKSKDDIYAAAIEKLLDDFLEALRTAVHSEEPVARFREFVGAHVRFQLERREEAGVYARLVGPRQLAASLPAARRAGIAERQRSYVDELRRILRNGLEQQVFSYADLRVTAFAVTTLCEYVHTWFNPGSQLAIDEVVSLYADLALRMVAAEPEAMPDEESRV